MRKANGLPVIASFWYGSDLSWLEALCIKSYLDRGHRFVLYTAEALSGIPDGTELRPASDILWPPPFDISDNGRLRVAVFSDLFRLHMLQKKNLIWVDLDAYCVRPFDFETPYVFARTDGGGFPTGVMGLPRESATLGRMIGFVMSENPSQPWRGAKLHRRNRQRAEQDEVWGIETLPWGSSGPKAFAHFLGQTGESENAMPEETFYPLAPAELGKLHDPGIDTNEIEREGVCSVHIYGAQKLLLAQKMAGLPSPGSYLDRLCQRHDIDPETQRISLLAWMRLKNIR